jgi:hypothetical protein
VVKPIWFDAQPKALHETGLHAHDSVAFTQIRGASLGGYENRHTLLILCRFSKKQICADTACFGVNLSGGGDCTIDDRLAGDLG